jgi:hypothetical protein
VGDFIATEDHHGEAAGDDRENKTGCDGILHRQALEPRWSRPLDSNTTLSDYPAAIPLRKAQRWVDMKTARSRVPPGQGRNLSTRHTLARVAPPQQGWAFSGGDAAGFAVARIPRLLQGLRAADRKTARAAQGGLPARRRSYRWERSACGYCGMGGGSRGAAGPQPFRTRRLGPLTFGGKRIRPEGEAPDLAGGLGGVRRVGGLMLDRASLILSQTSKCARGSCNYH